MSGSTSGGSAAVHLGVAVARLLQLQVFSRLAGQIHPLPLEPFDGGLLQQRLRAHSGHERDVLTCGSPGLGRDCGFFFFYDLAAKRYHRQSEG